MSAWHQKMSALPSPLKSPIRAIAACAGDVYDWTVSNGVVVVVQICTGLLALQRASVSASQNMTSIRPSPSKSAGVRTASKLGVVFCPDGELGNVPPTFVKYQDSSVDDLHRPSMSALQTTRSVRPSALTSPRNGR